MASSAERRSLATNASRSRWRREIVSSLSSTGRSAQLLSKLPVPSAPWLGLGLGLGFGLGLGVGLGLGLGLGLG